ncbi:MAG: GNAT family N-acetyltransferase, partial [Mycobacteriales bacterium]
RSWEPTVDHGRVHIRPATPDDAAAIVTIYAHYVTHSHATFDLEPPPPDAWAQRISRVRAEDGHHVLVAEDVDRAITGYAYSGSWRERAAYGRTVESSVYVATPGQGLGALLYDRLLERVDAGPAHRVEAGIALPNEASVRLHERCGFRHVGTFTEVGRKFGRWWDVAWYERPVRNGAPTEDAHRSRVEDH